MSIAGLPDVFGDHMTIVLLGIDTPEIKGKCGKVKGQIIEAYQVRGRAVLFPHRETTV